jgi:ABC-2 type transport system permease protein
MTTITTNDPTPLARLRDDSVAARPAGFWRDLATVAGRALRAIPREPEAFIPALIVPLFFFVVNVGSLSDISQFAGVGDFKAFQLPVAIIFAVTGISRASALVTDITSGYFDRLLVSPVNRYSLLLGLMVADLALVIVLAVPVLALGFALGIGFATGPLGVLAFLVVSGLWGLAFTGFPYTIALRTGNPAAVNSSFLLFFPFAFLTTTFLPQEALTGWLATAADYNPVTYVLAGLRALITEGWATTPILQALAAVGIVGLLSFTLAFSALRARVRRS